MPTRDLASAARPSWKLWLSGVSCLARASEDDEADDSGASNAKVEHPWRCLCFRLAGHITYSRPCLLIVLQQGHNFFTDDRTFILTDNPISTRLLIPNNPNRSEKNTKQPNLRLLLFPKQIVSAMQSSYFTNNNPDKTKQPQKGQNPRD